MAVRSATRGNPKPAAPVPADVPPGVTEDQVADLEAGTRDETGPETARILAEADPFAGIGDLTIVKTEPKKTSAEPKRTLDDISPTVIRWVEGVFKADPNLAEWADTPPMKSEDQLRRLVSEMRDYARLRKAGRITIRFKYPEKVESKDENGKISIATLGKRLRFKAHRYQAAKPSA